MKVVSVLAALACCGTTLSLAFGNTIAGVAAQTAQTLTALAAPAAGGLPVPEALALLGALVVFSSSAIRSKDM
jgi:hypothetical protein